MKSSLHKATNESIAKTPESVAAGFSLRKVARKSALLYSQQNQGSDILKIQNIQN